MATRYGLWQELRVVRTRTGWSSSDLARESGIQRSQLSELENGHRWPSPAVIKKLAVALRVPYTMLERTTDPNESAS